MDEKTPTANAGTPYFCRFRCRLAPWRRKGKKDDEKIKMLITTIDKRIPNFNWQVCSNILDRDIQNSLQDENDFEKRRVLA
ncbi:MAG: hypothetical protein WBM83_16695 [Flavobacteriaceae bacterium]